MSPTPPVLHGFSVDVEDWFHILDCDATPDPSRWGEQEDRVGLGTGAILELLDRFGHKATFFFLGWIAERHPELVREVALRGHEIGSHGHAHELVSAMTPDDFARDLDRSIEAIARAAGTEVTAYRAPGFSIGEGQTWALRTLVSRGIGLDASLFCAPRAHGGVALRRRRAFPIELASGATLLEVPVVPLRLGPALLPFSGGGYLRLLPAAVLDGLFSLAATRREPVTSYIHPRELDPDQPRMSLPGARRFKYYVGLHSVTAKLERLMRHHRFGTLSRSAASGFLDPLLRLAA